MGSFLDSVCFIVIAGIIFYYYDVMRCFQNMSESDECQLQNKRNKIKYCTPLTRNKEQKHSKQCSKHHRKD